MSVTDPNCSASHHGLCRPWKGNTRTLIRVIETACVSYALAGTPATPFLEDEHLREGILLWEPEEHPDANLYTSY